MGCYTSLKEALGAIASGGEAVLLHAGDARWDARSLLETLSERQLERRVHFMPGFYIAAVEDGEVLGEVLYRIKRKAA